MAQSVAARPAARRSRQSLKEDGDRSHIPREERSYLEYHPTLQTSVALTLVRQASQAIRHHSRQPSQLPPYPLHSRQNSIREVRHEVPDGFNQANGTQSPPTSGSVASADTADSRRDDFLAFGQLAPDLAAAAVADQLTPVGIDGHATALTNGRFQTTTQSSVPQSDSIAIDPALMDDLPIATPTALSVRSQRGSIHTAPSDRFLRSEVTVEEKFERLRKEDGFAIGVLNKPSFRKLEISLHNNRIKLTSNAIAFGYQANKPFERSSEAYVRTLDLPETELSDRVEYDMDEQDDFWLEAYNVRRRLREGDAISREIFEITLTKIEKEWAALERRIPKPEKKRQDDPASEDAKCSICDDGECENTNAIVFCDGCNLAVHQECYGVPYIPEGQWLCRKCFASPIDPVSCLFCPAKQGAFKQTSDLHWAHLLCTNWIPEVAVGNPVFMEPIEGVNNIPSSRWKLNCYICKLKVGACIQCSHKACYASFHVTCARRAKLFLQHNPQNPAGLGKTFCDKHLPEWYRAEVDVSASLHAAQQYFLNQGQDEHAPVIGAGVIPRGGGKFTISLKRSKQAAVIPAIVFNEILQYMQKFRIKNKADYIAEMCKYWSLKRRSRRGASLLKRLQIQSEDHTTTKLNAEEKQNKLGFANRLLQEFEQFHRPVLDDLAERENLKREICEMRDGLIEMLYLPLQQILHRVLEALEEADAQSTLARTVPLVEERIPFAITWPKLCRKVEETHYLSVAMFETDFNSMMSGLLDAFPTATKEYKTFLRLQEGSHAILDKARQTERLLQINPESLTATVFDEEYQPHGLQIYEERPWNWANREASPLSEVEDDFVEKIKDGYTDEEYNKRKGELQALLLTSDAQSSEAVTRPALQLPELPAVFSIVQQQREEWASAPVVSTALPARLISHAADLQERLKTIRPATAEQAKPRKRTLSINLKDDPAQPSPDRPRSAPKSRSRPATPLARPLTGSRACAPCKTKKTRCDGHHSRCIKNPNSPFYDPNYEVTLALTPAPLAVAPTSHRKKLPIATSTVASSAALFNAPAPDATSRSGRRLTSAHDRHSDLKVAAAVAEAVTALEVRQKQSATNVSSPSALPEAAAVEADPVAFETSPRAARLAKRVVASDSEVVASGQKRKVEEALEPEQAEAASLNEADNAAAGMPETPTRSSKRARRVYNT